MSVKNEALTLIISRYIRPPGRAWERCLSMSWKIEVPRRCARGRCGSLLLAD